MKSLSHIKLFIQILVKPKFFLENFSNLYYNINIERQKDIERMIKETTMTYIETYLLLEYLKENLDKDLDDVVSELEEIRDGPDPHSIDIEEKFESHKARLFLRMIKNLRETVHIMSVDAMVIILTENLKYTNDDERYD